MSKAHATAVPSTDTGADQERGNLRYVLPSAFLVPCKSLNALKSTASLRRRDAKTQPAPLPREHACERAATLPVVRLSVYGVTFDSRHLQTCRRAR